jgi:hypothetical protein
LLSSPRLPPIFLSKELQDLTLKSVNSGIFRDGKVVKLLDSCVRRRSFIVTRQPFAKGFEHVPLKQTEPREHWSLESHILYADDENNDEEDSTSSNRRGLILLERRAIVVMIMAECWCRRTSFNKNSMLTGWSIVDPGTSTTTTTTTTTTVEL